MAIDEKVGEQGVTVLLLARRWRVSRVLARRLMDSKTAKKSETTKAVKTFEKLSHELDKAIFELEKAVAESGQNLPMARPAAAKVKMSIPWGSVLGTISDIAKAAGDSVEAGRVIDATPDKD